MTREIMWSKRWRKYFKERWDKSAPTEEVKEFDGDFWDYTEAIARNKAWWGILEPEAAGMAYEIVIQIVSQRQERRASMLFL